MSAPSSHWICRWRRLKTTTMSRTVNATLTDCQELRKRVHPQGILLFDRGFFAGPIIEALNATRFDWMMPCKNTPTVKKALAGAGAGARGKVVQMAATGKDGEPARYWMKVARRRRGEEEEEGEDEEEEDEGAGGKKGKKDSSAPHRRLIGFASNLREIDISCTEIASGSKRGST